MSMDVVEYVRQRKRMCDYYANCGDCPACDYEWCSSLNEIPKMVPIVEQWTKEHPVKTRQSEFCRCGPMLILAMTDCQLLRRVSYVLSCFMVNLQKIVKVEEYVMSAAASSGCRRCNNG